MFSIRVKHPRASSQAVKNLISRHEEKAKYVSGYQTQWESIEVGISSNSVHTYEIDFCFMKGLKNSQDAEDANSLSTLEYIAGGALLLGVLGFVYAIVKTADICVTVTKWRDACRKRSERP